ncbi:hypothetical protein CROQUDRAFT_668977 [Cronartium quercuum f. sp. fusiforme G11]|uniref:ferric-chelate reductase (NADPH) n=1 Tax=Cronartium quercuum f. sp. fusiforme G11 TaxID=708437 RepID=A0A9P6NTC2_9BASI|nr:hypothetical protein CROQUDRAFT_668977 [Cronartium quercuum f. sp. fusiforme G11]
MAANNVSLIPPGTLKLTNFTTRPNSPVSINSTSVSPLSSKTILGSPLSSNTTSETGTSLQSFTNNSTLDSSSSPNASVSLKPQPPPGSLSQLRKTDINVLYAFNAVHLAVFVLAFLFSLPFIAKRLSNPRAKQGWILRRNNKSTEISDIMTDSKLGDGMGRQILARSSFEVATTFLTQRFTLNRPLKHARMSVGRILIVMLYILIVVGALMFNNINTTSFSRHFRRFGFISLAQLPTLFLLSMKNNICSLFGQSYERVNFLHRLIGRCMMICALAHGIMILQIQTASLGTVLSRPVFYHGAIALAILILISLTSVSPIRSSVFQIFRIIHILGYITFTIALWQHVASSHNYIFFGAGCVMVDRLLRIFNTRWGTAHFTSLPGSVTMIEVTKTGTGWKAGQHVFLRVYSPKYILEKHPFTIANAPASHSPYGTNNTLILVTKAHGDYTRKLHQVGLTKAALEPECNYNQDFKGDDFGEQDPSIDSQLMVSIEGPYGSSKVDLRMHETAVLIASGIGITFCVSLLEEIVGSALRGIGVTRRVFLIWTLKDIDMVEAFINPIQETLRVARALDLHVTFGLYVTSSMGTFEPDPVPELQLISARPNLRRIVQEAVDVTLTEVNARDGAARGSGVALAVCTGVDSLVRDIEDAVRVFDRWTVDRVGGIELHLESFGDG